MGRGGRRRNELNITLLNLVSIHNFAYSPRTGCISFRVLDEARCLLLGQGDLGAGVWGVVVGLFKGILGDSMQKL